MRAPYGGDCIAVDHGSVDLVTLPTGANQGKTFDHVEDQGKYRVVIYHLVFGKEPDVTLSVTFKNSKSHLIFGTYWTSE